MLSLFSGCGRMLATRTWVVIVIVQISALALLSAWGTQAARVTGNGGGLLVLRALGVTAIVGIFTCAPVALVKVFIALQQRIGNGEHALVQFLQRHADGLARVMLIVWLIGAIVAVVVIARLKPAA